MYVVVVLACVAGAVGAKPLDNKCGTHTWHNVTAYKGTWAASITPIDEPATFVRDDCSEFPTIGHFKVNTTYSPQFGFRIGKGDDFNVAYSLVFVRTDPHEVQSNSSGRRLFSDMACVFTVAAAGPAMPDVRAEPYNGAVCMWQRVDGVGEDYFLDFNA